MCVCVCVCVCVAMLCACVRACVHLRRDVMTIKLAGAEKVEANNSKNDDPDSQNEEGAQAALD